MNVKTLLFSCLLSFQSLVAVAQIYSVRAHLEEPQSFSMIVVPDPQSYIKFAANQPLFELQTAWIAIVSIHCTLKQFSVRAIW